MPSSHPALTAGAVAVITGGASGIGLAAAKKFASLGMRVAIADLGAERLENARHEIAGVALAARKTGGNSEDVIAREIDVSRVADLVLLESVVRERFGGTDVLMNNAGTGIPTTALGPLGSWERLLEVNLWGVIHGTQAFVPGMLLRGRPGLVINTGSKQGITTPPGNPAYNVSKAAVKAYTEALEHELRNTERCLLDAHLLIPGFVFTGMTAARGVTEKPAGAWTPEQTVDFMVEKLAAGDFYILCPDNEAPRELDEKRILWAAGDVVENRPPLSRWHPDYADKFKAYVATAAGAATKKE